LKIAFTTTACLSSRATGLSENTRQLLLSGEGCTGAWEIPQVRLIDSDHTSQDL
jgi:hypothetical protein